MKKRTKPIWIDGIHSHAGGRDARVFVGSGKTRLHAARRFEADESLRVVKEWQREERVRLEKLRPRASRGSFDDDVARYLLTLADRPRLQAERKHQLAWWANQHGTDGRRFGDRRRHTFQRAELHAALAARANIPSKHLLGQTMSASSLRHYRTALFHLYSTLDGKSSPNPVRDVPAPRSPDAEPRAIPYAIIEAIFDAMQDRQRASKVTPAQAATIADLARRPGANRSAIAKTYGITETAVRQIVATAGRPRDDPAAKTKLRLRVMAYVGLAPAQIMTLRESDVNWDESSVLVQGRRKGKGSRTARLPLTQQGVEALRDFFAGGAAGRFDTSSARRVWWRAINAMVRTLALTDQPAADELLASLRRFRARPYDLRHSFLTEMQLAGRNLSATQHLAMHVDSRQTQRYTLAAVNTQVLDVVSSVGARLGDHSKQRG